MGVNKLRIRKENGLILRYNPITRLISVYTKDNQAYPTKLFDSNLLKYPVRAVVDITGSCNANCGYCSQKHHRYKKGYICKDEVYRIIDEIKRMKVFELTIRGGEALTHDNFRDIWDYAEKDKFLSLNIITNAMLLTRELIDFLLKKPTSKIIISLDGLEKINSKYRDPKQFGLVMRWLHEILRLYQNQIVILSTLYKGDYEGIIEFGRYMASLGLRYHHITLLKRLGDAETNDELFITCKDVKKIEKKLNKISKEFAEYSPMIAYHYSRYNRQNKLMNIPIPLFTDTYSNAGLKITSAGDVGISKMVFFTDYFKSKVKNKIKVNLNPLGNIRHKEYTSLKDIWEQKTEIRLKQGKVIDAYYDYFIGWGDIK